MTIQINRLIDWLENQWAATEHGTNECPEERAYRNGMGYAYYKTLIHILDTQKEEDNDQHDL